jgi:protease I
MLMENDHTKLLHGKKVAVLVETEFIPSEVAHYKKFFENLGGSSRFYDLLMGRKRENSCQRCGFGG